MSYLPSQLDKDNRKWFKNDKTRNSLVGITVNNGNIRGVYPCHVDFSYPISAFVGENGSGKSTLLALAACAFHNNDSFYQFSRKKSYFTYGDFFTFSPEERGLQNIKITYKIRQEDGDKTNIRHKKPSGKWNDFNTRKNRKVIYLGVNRIVPPSESSAHKSYRKTFEAEEIDPKLLSTIKLMACRIFGKKYEDLKILVHSSYRLFLAERNEIFYSGFNMGAGENDVVSILLDLLSAGQGTLMVIDEIELGLHAKAQEEFITVLKEICKKNKCQIICSTHSEIILNKIPPQGRFFVQNQGTQTIITPEISAEYAFGKLAEQNTHELDVFVEDVVGKDIIENIVSKQIRERINIYIIGSDQAILRQMAARYREDKNNYIAFLDGDKRQAHDQQINDIDDYLETRINDQKKFRALIDKRLQYIPGDTWPEKSFIQYLQAIDEKSSLAEHWDISIDAITLDLEKALIAGKHKEFHTLSKALFMEERSVRIDCVRFFKTNYQEMCDEINNEFNCVLASI